MVGLGLAIDYDGSSDAYSYGYVESHVEIHGSDAKDLSDASRAILHWKMNQTRMTRRVQLLHWDSIVPALPRTPSTDVQEVALDSHSGSEDRG